MATHTIDVREIENVRPQQEKCKNTLFEKFNSGKKKCREPLEMFLKKMFMVGRSDPRRVIHSIKVGLALSVVSLFYLMEPLFEGVGDNAIWAIMTVVVVFEFTVGGTLSKGLNRGIGTVIAGSLAVSVGYIAEKTGKLGEPIVIGSCCFILGAGATFFRFFPMIKLKYDYGVVVFILTFNMISVSGYRVDNIFRMAYERLSTIAIGCAVALVISLCICPIWAGEDLHCSTIKRIHGLGDSLEGCMLEYFKGSQFFGTNEGESAKKVEGYKDVLESKASEESLANFASWEPGHGMFRFRHPWKQYVKVGSMLRHMAYCVVALHRCLWSENQEPIIYRLALEKPSVYKVGMEVAKILHELAESIKCMTQCPPPKSMMQSLHVAVGELNTSFCFQPKIWRFIQPIYKPDQSSSSSLEAKNFHGNLTQQSSQTEQGPPEYQKDVHEFEDNVHVNICLEASVALKEHYLAVNKGEQNHVLASIEAPAKCIKVAKYGVGLSEEVHMAAFASLLIEIVGRLDHVIEAVQELGRLAGFKQNGSAEV